MPRSQKALVFISHITEEKKIALSFQGLVETCFLNMIEVFVSSDAKSITPGSPWLDEIKGALKRCSVEIILASPTSVKRPWVNWEGGAGWIKDIPVIPLCHSGMTPAKLPPPLSALRGATATELAELEMIFPVLAEAIGATPPKPDFSQFIQVVKEYEATSQQIKELEGKSPIAPTDGLLPHELATLVEIAEQANTPNDDVSVYTVRKEMEKAGVRKIAVNLAISALCRKDMAETTVSQDFNGGDYQAVRITAEGWRWLEANQDKLRLTNQVDPFDEPSAPAKPLAGEEDNIPF
jgi:hypothetical protein